ncbi:MAG: TRAP transporter substrate-binding protein DctP [Proteobacteria bacterium]|nr:TRAP transporter substrate-binding protein DctP [Pseudomonadota bacterium]
MQRVAILSLCTIFCLIVNCQWLQAAPKHLFKIASLAPAGSVWVEQFENFAKEVNEKTGGEVGFRVYPGGVMGDDQAMFRKMRVGQLHGGGFTMTGIATVVPDFRVMAIPSLFETYEEVDFVKEGLLPTFKERFREKDLEFIALTEVGFIYAMSTQPINTIEQLQQSKNWSPAGDPISENYLMALEITPVQLSIPDVLSSLQSGLIETVYNSLYGSIVLQWFTKAKYVIDVPYGYAYGVFALDGKKFDTLPEAHQQTIHAAAAIHFPILLNKTRESNSESRQVMVDRGTEFQKIDKKTTQVLHEKSEQTVNQLIPDSLSKAIHDQTMELLSQYRNKPTGGKPID